MADSDLSLSSPTASGEISETRRKMIWAAGEIFAECGFHKATVRQITERAGVNIAAVNYHFRDKAELYASVLRECQCAARMREGISEFDRSASPKKRLRQFIAWFVGCLLHAERPPWHGMLMAREMIEPTEALDLIVAESIRPQAEELRAILRTFLGAQVSERKIIMTGFSVIGQCLFYLHDRPMIERLYPSFQKRPPTTEEIVDHVYEFSLGAIRACAHSQP